MTQDETANNEPKTVLEAFYGQWFLIGNNLHKLTLETRPITLCRREKIEEKTIHTTGFSALNIQFTRYLLGMTLAVTIVALNSVMCVLHL